MPTPWPGGRGHLAAGPLPFAAGLFNSAYTQAYVNTNGTVSFRAANKAFGVPPTITLAFQTRLLEGNAPGGYAGYDGSADAAVSLAQGTTLASFARTPAPGTFLPLGDTPVTWTATASTGRTAIARQVLAVADTPPPSGPSSLWSDTHAAGSWTATPTAEVSWSADATDACSGVSGYLAGWYPDTSGVPTAPLPAGALLSSTSLADGTWYFLLSTRDAAGNVSAASTYGPMLVGTVPPSAASSMPGGWVTDPAFALVLTATDPSPGSGVAGTSYHIDGGGTEPYSSPVPLPDGVLAVEYSSVDVAGNPETARQATLRKDSTPPTPPGGLAVSVNSTDRSTPSIGTARKSPSCPPGRWSTATSPSCPARPTTGGPSPGTWPATSPPRVPWPA